jgi:hypothetical protein
MGPGNPAVHDGFGGMTDSCNVAYGFLYLFVRLIDPDTYASSYRVAIEG